MTMGQACKLPVSALNTITPRGAQPAPCAGPCRTVSDFPRSVALLPPGLGDYHAVALGQVAPSAPPPCEHCASSRPTAAPPAAEADNAQLSSQHSGVCRLV